MKQFFILSLLLSTLFVPRLQAQLDLDSLLSKYAYLDKIQNYVEFIEWGKPAQLPLGIRTHIGGATYDLMLAEASFHSQYTEISIYLRVTLPGSEKNKTVLYFGSDDIKVSKEGGFIGQVKLALFGNYELPYKSDVFTLRLKGADKKSGGLPQSFAEVDCDGFKQLSIAADLIFSNQYVHPVIAGELRPDKNLTVSFKCDATDISDILMRIQIPEFELAGFENWRFSIEEAIIDMSEIRNESDMDFYAGEKKGGYPGGIDAMSELWTGVYISRASITLPHYLKNEKSEKSPTFFVEKLWFDERGFGGKVGVEDILNLEEGNLGGWGFSIEKLALDFEANKIKGGGLDGKILLPLNEKNALLYKAEFSSDHSLFFKASMEEQFSFPLFKADNVTLFKTSYVEMKIDSNEKVRLTACLSGKMNINPFLAEGEIEKEGEKVADFGSIGFTSMKIQNVEPYFSITKLEYDKEIKVNNFPASISGITLRTPQNQTARLEFDLNVHLSSQKDGAFKGSLGIGIGAKLKEVGSRQKWAFDYVQIDDISVDASNAAFKLKGLVKIFRDDKVYGNGFQGEVDFKLIPMDLQIKSKLMFGSTPTFRYWYADALVNLGRVGIPIFPGFMLNGFGGGAYQRMRPETSSEKNRLGNSATESGLKYVPDSTINLGLKASVCGATQAPDLFNVELSLSMGFSENNGIDHIRFQGVGKLMKDMPDNYFTRLSNQVDDVLSISTEAVAKKRSATASDAVITASVFMTFDANNKSLYGRMDSYINAGFLKGNGADGSVGSCEMYFSPSRWHLYLGTPEKPLGVKFKLGPIELNTGMYFMGGDNIPPMPAPPGKTGRLLKTDDMRNLSQARDISSIKNASGLAFGANLKFSTGDLNFLIFYAAFESELGFDVNLRNYKNLQCRGREGAIGLNGWYASGQAYTYLYGALGLRLHIFGQKRNLPILEGELAALLQANLPNPSWFSGKLVLRYSILNGLVRGDCNFKFELGDKCELYETSFAEGQSVIADIKPVENNKEVDIVALPQVAFNMPIDTQDLPLDGIRKKVRINLDKYTISNVGKNLSATKEWNIDKNIVSYKSHEMLPSKTNLELEVQISVQEWADNQWKALKTSEGKSYVENKKYSFTTGAAPDSILSSNIEYSYPIKGQNSYYIGESKQSYIKLKQGQAYLFADAELLKRIYLIAGKDTLQTSFTYNKSTNRLSWNMPSLKSSTHYTLLICTEAKENIIQTTSENYKQVLNTEGSTLEQKTHSLGAETSKNKMKKIVHRISFRTSAYSTMSAKIEALHKAVKQVFRTPYPIVNSNTGAKSFSPDMHYLQAHINNMEKFDESELKGSAASGGKALIKAEAELSTNAYFKNKILPLIYAKYNYSAYVKFPREADQSLYPSWAVFVSLFYTFQDGCTQFPWIYYSPVYYKNDYNNMLKQLASAIANKGGFIPQKHYAERTASPYPLLEKGEYQIRYQYIFPDGSFGTQITKSLYNSVQ